VAAAGGEEAVVRPALKRDHSAELRVIRTFPIFLAGFLAVLAVVAVTHTLATAVRRRRHDMAVLRAVGLTRWQCRSAVVTHAVVIARDFRRVGDNLLASLYALLALFRPGQSFDIEDQLYGREALSYETSASVSGGACR
jgi:DNA-directed RNA polymerase subunit N (RpoN/RPB10)